MTDFLFVYLNFYTRKNFMMCEVNMYLFKRYDEKTNILASYLPWLYLVKDNIIRNKDGSLLCAFIYEDIDTAILKQIAVSNISLWIDYVDK